VAIVEQQFVAPGTQVVLTEVTRTAKLHDSIGSWILCFFGFAHQESGTDLA